MPSSAQSTVRLFTPGFHTLPPELLENIAFYYICPRILGPPISLTPLLLASKSSYRNLTNAKHLYARVFKYKFSFSAIRRRGFEPSAGEWASQLRSWCKVLRSVRRRRRRPAQEQYVDEVCDDIGMEEPDVQETMYTLWLMCLEDDGCNRLQMQISGVYEWVEGYILGEMYKVLNKGWPIANAANSCAMWVLWYLSSKVRLLEEPPVQRERLIELVLPFLTVPFRYPGAFAPANHFRLPFNASSSPSFSFSEPTVTAHGPYPIYIHPSSHTWNLPHFDRWTSLSTPLAADAAKLVYFSRRETMPFPVPEAFPRNREEHRERVRALLAAENAAAGGQGQVSEFELDMMLQNELPRPTQDDFLELNEGLLGGVMVDGSTRSSPYKCKGGGTGLPCAHDRWDEVRRMLPTLLDSPSFVDSDLDEAERILFADESGRGCIDESTCQSRRWDADWWRLRLCRSCWVNRAGLDDAADRDEGEQRGTTSEEVEDIAGEDDSEDEGDEEEGRMDQHNLAVTEQVQDGKMNDYDADTDTEMDDTGIHDSYDNDTERSPTFFTGYPQKGALYTPGVLNGLWTGRMVIPSESELRALLLPPAPADPPQGEPLPPVNLPNGPAPNMPVVPPPPDNQNLTPPPPPLPAAAAPPAPANANPAAASEIGHRPGSFTEDTLGLVAVPLYVRLKEYAVYNGGKVVPCAADTDIIAGEDDDDLDANLSFGSGPGSSSFSTSSPSPGSSSHSSGTGTQGQEWSGGPGPGYPISNETFDQGIADAWFPQFSTLSTSASAGARGGGGRDKLVVSVPAQSLPPQVGGRGGKRKGVGVEEYEYVAVDEEAVARAVNDADADESLRIPGTFHDRETCSGCRAREEALRAARARDETEAQFGHLSTSSDTSPVTRSGSGGGDGSSLPDSTMEEPDSDSDSDSDLPPYVPSPSTIPVCNGIRDVIITGTTDARHANAWGKWAWKGRVRKWDGLIGMIREPALDGPSGLAPGGTGGAGKIFFYGTLVGGKNLVGTWRMANQDPRMPAYEGAFTLGRKEEEE
ncbi:hypothetical protein GYMLUDRAFT_245443 [Collybiopsis luxurians FD-317 M1]|uniref:Unplaced genomic scaffold GYMLUscaffold_32, whole genome shotgun sequence n=1 Tax=Collybiopsis luxurians FD-317 M1 TaxID=944289 RepID=A0A0D0B7C4_9AGAR|nr:hypothetical protein GYMLUDRAFT_245443 [Collybiopsis luxurians FD-317 M1]